MSIVFVLFLLSDPCFSVEICGAKLQAHYKKTAKVPISVWSRSSRVDIDQVYTRLSVVKRKVTLAGSEQSELGHYSNLFTPIGKGNQPKKILVQGETGIGKSTFAKKLAVDWARLDEAPTFSSPVSPGPPTSCFQFLSRRFRGRRETLGFEDENTSSTEDEQTAVLRKSRTPAKDEQTAVLTKSSIPAKDEQTAVLRKFKLVVCVDLKEVSKCQSLKDVIYNSRLFAREDKWLVEGLLNYMTNHQDEVLLLLDGYDEYHCGQESQIFDIFSGNELRDCCVLITSRISKAGELQKFQDLLAEITGFSEEDKLTYITRQLGDKENARDLYEHLIKNDLLDLAKVPLLLLFFCMLWKKEKSEGFSKGKTSLYLKIVQHVLSHNQGKDTSPHFSTVEYNSEILNQIGKLALECLLNYDHIFQYDKVSSEVLCEESVVSGLLQVSDCTESLQPAEMVSFIHKSIQEFLAAWFVTHKCKADGNLGLIEERTQTLKSCHEFETVLLFVCGLSDEGAGKVFDHLKSVRINDPSLDISEAIPDENHKYKPLDDVVRRHLQFGHLVFHCFEEVHVHSKQKLAKVCIDCFGGITVLMESPSYLALLFSSVNSWTFIFGLCEISWTRSQCVLTHSKVAETLNCLDATIKITENSENIPLGVFLRKFLDVECKMICNFSSVLHIRDGDVNVYFRSLSLHCDAHARLFTESAQAASLPCPSANLVPGKTSLKFLSTLYCVRLSAMKDLGAVMKICTHFMRIFLFSMEDSVCDFLKQLPHPNKCDLKLTCKLMSKGTEELAKLLPSFENITELRISFDRCCAEKASVRLVSSITHKSLIYLWLCEIDLTPAVAAAFGLSLPRLSSLQHLDLVGTGDTRLNVEDMSALFGGIDKDMPLQSLTFNHVRVSGSLNPLTRKLSFFPHLAWLCLDYLDLSECDLQDLETSFSVIPNLESLGLSGNALDHLQKPLDSFLMKLGKIEFFYCVGCKLSRETLRNLEEARPHLCIYPED